MPHRDDEGCGDAAGILHSGGEVTALSQRLEAAAGGVVELAHLRAQDLAGAHVVHQRDRVRIHRQRDHAVQDAGDRQAKFQAAAAAVGRLFTSMHCLAQNTTKVTGWARRNKHAPFGAWLCHTAENTGTAHREVHAPSGAWVGLQTGTLLS